MNRTVSPSSDEQRKAKAREYAAEYYRNNKAKARDYYQKNKDKIKARAAAWRLENRDRYLDQQRDYDRNRRNMSPPPNNAPRSI